MKTLITLGFAAIATFSLAQGGPPLGGPPQGGPGGGQGGPGQRQSGGQRQLPRSTVAQADTIRLLGTNIVQNELGLTLAQWTSLNALVRNLKGSTLSEDAALASVSKILTEAQLTRLKELLVQDLGYTSLEIASVRSQISLTEDQSSQIEAIFTSLNTATRALQTSADPAAAQAAIKELRSQANTQIAKLLTADQDTKLRSLGGRAFTNRTSGANSRS